MYAHLRTPLVSGEAAHRSDGPLRPWRTALAVIGLALGSSLLLGSPVAASAARDLPPAAPLRPIVVAQDGASTSATVTELMPGVGGELELVEVTGRVVGRAPLTAARPAELTADAAASYRLRFRQEAATTDGAVSVSGLALSASDPFPLAAGGVVVAVVAPR